MELDQESTTITQHAPKPAETETTSIVDDGASEMSIGSPVETQTPNKRAVEHDSLVTVRLSEPPPPLHVNTTVPSSALPTRRSLYGREDTPTDETTEKTGQEQADGSNNQEAETPVSDHGLTLQQELAITEEGDQEFQDDGPKSPGARSSSDSEDVDWEGLQKTENLESKEQDSDNSTAMLLAKLEQENAKIATNPKSVKVQAAERKLGSPLRQPRPPSMAQLRQMVNGPTPSALRYSVVPPPPMTELEFYMALVKDPQQTAARLPTLLSNKIRKGIPPPLRGVVWQSMSGARDSTLEAIFERLSGESSPYEGLIGKDLGRSFPGVEMFRDPEGDGQRMLGTVLKCFSLYDTKIGYCQGLAFLVGPLLMHMADKQAFCVLVRLMENYDLRHCFVPDLSGLHVRIHQFQELLKLHLPILSAHLDDLQVEPAYVSQWFLSFFAVTCPLPMLFRIYDVIFAEGASETVMRVALSLMQKNQARILACTEMEDVMQLLLSRGLWDCYHYNADEFVQDFVKLSDVVSRERMAALEQGYREAKVGSATKSTDAAQASDVTTAASRFLGRLWASSSTPKLASFPSSITSGPASSSSSSSQSTPSSSTLSPRLIAASRPLSMLRRSTSKQSIASTLNSMEATSAPNSSAASVLSSASTEATSISRDSAADDSSRGSAPAIGGANSKSIGSFSGGANAAKDDSKYLHSQIEDLLTALSELQRNHALLSSQLQKEREDRDEDRKAVRSLLDGLRKKASTETVTPSRSGESEEPDTPENVAATDNDGPTAEQLSDLLDVVENRFGDDAADPSSSIPETKSQLRDEVARAKEQLSHEMAKTQDCQRRIYEMEQEVSSIKDQLKESHAHVRNMHQEKQRLERQMHGMKVRASDTPSSGQESGDWFSRATGGLGMGGGPTATPATGGLRELKLGRSKSTPSQAPTSFGKRTSSITLQRKDSRESLIAPHTAPFSEHDALLLELAQAKTSEAMARQEAEEAKQKLETLRKAFGLAPGDTPSATGPTAATGASAAASAAIGMFGRLTGSTPAANAASTVPTASSGAGAKAQPAGAGTNTGTGAGFWGWRKQ
ncbi:GTPase-activating protein GYP5 [Rhypophila decipiens]|uniref:GTPase-activating protein GYP5 n=1 Tax=Rhypophila decipiens TaxID=261697 RepID=A0AAN6YH88_9PEZI|nr:GTPase-activating protein GYP5 [Rhypophila decipiens]